MTEWISVRERLPGNSNVVLARSKGNEVFTARFWPDYSSWDYELPFSVREVQDGQIVSWQPWESQ